MFNFYPFRKLKNFLNNFKIPGMHGMNAMHIIRIYFTGIFEGNLTTRAAAVSWSLFLSLFPFLLFVYSWLPFLPNFEDIERTIHVFLVERIFPYNQAVQIENYVSIIAKRNNISWFTMILTILFATNGIHSLMDGFYNVSRQVDSVKERSTVAQYTVAALFTIFATIFILGFLWIANYVLGFGRELLEDVLEDPFLIKVVSYLVLYLVAFIFFTMFISVLYYFGVDFDSRFRKTFPGAVMTTLLFFVLSVGFSFYLENFNNYNLLYGSLSTLLIVMLFLYITVLIILLGFELNIALLYARQEQKAKMEEMINSPHF